VEAFLGGFWLQFDPSPRTRRFERGDETLWTLTKQKIDYLNFLWNAHVLGYDMEAQKNFARKVEIRSSAFGRVLDRKIGEWKGGIEHRGSLWKKGLFQWRGIPDRSGFIYILALASCLFIIFRYRKNLKNYLNLGPPGKPDLPTGFYREMLRIFSRNGLGRREDETPREFACRVMGRTGGKGGNEIETCLLLVTETFYKVRFSAIPATAQEISLARNSLRALKKLVPHFLKTMSVPAAAGTDTLP
jgi:hypothetical protein